MPEKNIYKEMVKEYTEIMDIFWEIETCIRRCKYIDDETRVALTISRDLLDTALFGGRNKL